MSVEGKFDVEISVLYATVLMRAQRSAIVSCTDLQYIRLAPHTLLYMQYVGLRYAVRLEV